jgi:hypothetical protein
MPAINVAMERSLRRGLLDFFVASLRPALAPRDAISNAAGQINDVKTAFSSWDNCMQAAYCKWPVIALIVIGGLIIASVLWCIIRCACCGLSCCCECFQCLKCCGNCCGCCDPPRGTPHKHLDNDRFGPTAGSKQAYHSQAPMAFPTSRVPEPPQYAEFDVSKRNHGDDDALPAMPNWDGAGKKKVLVEDDDVEMDQLKKPETNGQAVPLMTGAGTSPGPASPSHSPGPYASHDMYNASGGYGAGAATADPYAQAQQRYGQSQGYGPSTSSLGVDQSYGVASTAMGADRRSPRHPMEQQGYGGASGYGQTIADSRYTPSSRPGQQGAYDQYSRSRQASYDDYGQAGAQSYGNSQQRRQPPPRGAYGQSAESAFTQDGFRRSPRPAPQGGYNDYSSTRPPYTAESQRQYSSDSSRPFVRQDPQGHYNAQPESPSNLTNNGGFDFNSGYSRPQTAGEGNPAAWPARGPQQAQETNAYPGYRSYRPNDNNGQQGW